MVQIRHILWSRVSSPNKGAGEGELLREGRSMTNLDPAVACIQKESFTLSMKQPSSGQFLFLCTPPNVVETFCDALADVVTFLAPEQIKADQASHNISDFISHLGPTRVILLFYGGRRRP